MEKYQEAAEGQMQFQVEFYEMEDGRSPTREFLDSLEPKMNAKMVGLMEILEEKGYRRADRHYPWFHQKNSENTQSADRAGKEIQG